MPLVPDVEDGGVVVGLGGVGLGVSGVPLVPDVEDGGVGIAHGGLVVHQGDPPHPLLDKDINYSIKSNDSVEPYHHHHHTCRVWLIGLW